MSIGRSDCTTHAPAPPFKASDDDAWLHAAAVKLSNPIHWSVALHHRARLEWLAKNAIPRWTDALRQLGWNAVLQYPQVAEECGIKLRPMPAAVRAAKPVMPRLTAHTIHADRTHFTCAVPQSDAYAMLCIRSVGMQWQTRRSSFCAQINGVSAEFIAKLQTDYGFTLDPTAAAAIAAQREISTTLRTLSSATADTFTVAGLSATPHPYQSAGIRYLVETKRCFLADDMGLGKTLQSLAAVCHLGAWPCGVVTLATVKDCWRNEVAKWLPGVACHVWSGRTGAPTIYGNLKAERVVHVINYDVLPARLDEWQALGLASVIFDESHSCRNGKSARTKACRELAKRKPVRFCLTGTPSGNAPVELLPQLQMLSRLDDLGGFAHFTKHYLGARRADYGWDMSGAQNLAELHEKLRSVCFLRRRKEQVQSELPESIVTRVPITLSREGIAHYNAALKDVKAWLAARAPLKPEFLRSIATLPTDEQDFRKAAEIAAAMERLDGMELLHQFGVLRHAVLKAKVPAMVDWLLHHAEGEKLVLFGHHRAGLRDIAPALAAVAPLLIDGDVPTGKRAGIVRDFRTIEKHRVLLANYDAAGTGLDGLQHIAHHFCAAEWPWTPGKLRQAISRLDRQGQKSTVMQWHLYAPGTIDDESLELLQTKAATTDTITDGTPAGVQREAFTKARAMGVRMIL